MKCEEKKPTWGTDLGGSAAAILYISVSCGLTLLNKEILSKYNFNYVFLLVTLQQTSLLISLLIGKITLGVNIQMKMQFPPSYSLILSIVTFQLYVCTSLLALKYVSIPLYTILRKTGMISTLVIQYIYDGCRLSSVAYCSIAVMVIGVFMAGMNDLNFDFRGYLITLCCNLLTSVYLVSISWHKEKTGDSANTLLWHSAIYSIITFGLLSFVSGDFTDALKYEKLNSIVFLLCLCSSIFLAGLLNLATVVNTRANSATTQAVCANVKDSLLVVLGYIYNPFHASSFFVIGTFLTLLGGIGHGFQKSIENSVQRLNLKNLMSCLNFNKTNALNKITLAFVTILFFDSFASHQLRWNDSKKKLVFKKFSTELERKCPECWELTQIQVPKQRVANIIFTVATTGKYIERAQAFMSSVRKNSPGTFHRIVFTLGNLSERDIICDADQVVHLQLPERLSPIQTSAYAQNIRVLLLLKLLNLQKPKDVVMFIGATTLVRKPLDQFIAHARNYDAQIFDSMMFLHTVCMGTNCTNIFQETRLLSSMWKPTGVKMRSWKNVYVGRNGETPEQTFQNLRYKSGSYTFSKTGEGLKLLETYWNAVVDYGVYKSYADQRGLYELMQSKNNGSGIARLHYSLIDWDFQPSSPVWVAKGRRKAWCYWCREASKYSSPCYPKRKCDKPESGCHENKRILDSVLKSKKGNLEQKQF